MTYQDGYRDGVDASISWLTRISMSQIGNPGGEKALDELMTVLRGEREKSPGKKQ